MPANNFIRNLQNKPEGVKKQVVWLMTFAAGLAIAALWVMSAQSKLAELSRNSDTALGKPLPNEFKEEVKNVNQELPTIGSSLKTILDVMTKKDASKKEDTKEETANTETQNKESSAEESKPARLPVE